MSDLVENSLKESSISLTAVSREGGSEGESEGEGRVSEREGRSEGVRE